jgi:uncharacterized protein YndB with AHSA1/START domain
VLWKLGASAGAATAPCPTTLEDLGDGRTRVVTTALFHTAEERNGMLSGGMEQGLNESYAALDRRLAK